MLRSRGAHRPVGGQESGGKRAPGDLTQAPDPVKPVRRRNRLAAPKDRRAKKARGIAVDVQDVGGSCKCRDSWQAPRDAEDRANPAAVRGQGYPPVVVARQEFELIDIRFSSSAAVRQHMKNVHGHSLPGLSSRLGNPLPERLGVGAGTALLVAGSTEHSSRQITSLSIQSANEAFRPLVGRVVRHSDGRRWEWWALVEFGPVSAVETRNLAVVAELRGGETATSPLGEIELHPRTVQCAERELPELPDSGEPGVAVAMATWNPPTDLFRAQIESIRAQSHRNWVCVISDDASAPESIAAMEEVLGDDARFTLHRHSERLGFYGNFERVLALIPETAKLVALSDQDDRWHANKLAALASGFGPGTMLAYSDMRIVDSEGALLSPTYWSRRPTNHADIGKLLVANTITGAASMFRRELLDQILPFPPARQAMFHDHWVALVALSRGEISYCERALSDYVQHGAAALGHEGANRGADPAPKERLKWLRLASEATLGAGAPNFYEDAYLPALVMARTLELRGDASGDRRKARAVRAISDSSLNLDAIRLLAAGALRSGSLGTATLGRERWFLASLAWQALARARRRARLR